jgi:hypothetical protein
MSQLAMINTRPRQKIAATVGAALLRDVHVSTVSIRIDSTTTKPRYTTALLA